MQTKKRNAAGPDDWRLKMAQHEEKVALYWLPGSIDDFRKRTVQNAVRLIAAAVDAPLQRWGWGGYRFTPDGCERIHEAAADLIELLQNEEVIFDTGSRAKAIAAIRAKTAKCDGALQNFLAGAANGAADLVVDDEDET